MAVKTVLISAAQKAANSATLKVSMLVALTAVCSVETTESSVVSYRAVYWEKQTV